jgi:hypothetical protein
MSFKARTDLTFSLKLPEVAKRPWFKWIVTVVLVPILISAAFFYGQEVQSQNDQKNFQQQLDSRFNHIDCTLAQILYSDYNSAGESVSVVTNPDGTCSLQFDVGITATIAVSASFSVSIGCPASYHETLMFTMANHSSYTYNGQTIPELVSTWTNCSSQSIQFAVHASPLTIVLNTYGNTSKITGELCNSYCGAGCPAGQCTFNVSAHSQTTLTISISTNGLISPNTQILHINGNITAIDPVTGQAISTLETFAA